MVKCTVFIRNGAGNFHMCLPSISLLYSVKHVLSVYQLAINATIFAISHGEIGRPSDLAPAPASMSIGKLPPPPPEAEGRSGSSNSSDSSPSLTAAAVGALETAAEGSLHHRENDGSLRIPPVFFRCPPPSSRCPPAPPASSAATTTGAPSSSSFGWRWGCASSTAQSPMGRRRLTVLEGVGSGERR
uniref:Uncharacterized protein n=1 Tax=Arundo donax TaxID=35708 RepID=A0A0A8ZZF5_ARUDO